MLAAELVIDLLSEAGKITDKNPYVWFRTAIDERANFQLSDAWFGIIYTDNILLLISFICYVVTLLIRWKNGSLWFFKIAESQGGPLLTPNTTNVFSLISIAYAIVSATSNTFMVLAYKGIGRVDVYQMLNAIQWPLTIMAIVSELHGICVFLLLGSGQTAHKLLGWSARSAMAFNIGFACLYFIVICSIGIPYAISSYYFTSGMGAIRMLTDAITVSARAWRPGQKFRFDAGWVDAISALDVWTPYMKYNRMANQTYLGMMITVVLIFVPVSIVYAVTLRDQIKGLDELQFSSSRRSRDMQRLRNSYHLIAVEMVLVLLAAAAYSIVVSLWTYRYDAIVADVGATGLVLGIRYSIYPFLSFFVSITLLTRAVLGRTDSGKAGTANMTGSGSTGMSKSTGKSSRASTVIHIPTQLHYLGPQRELAEDKPGEEDKEMLDD